MCDVRRAMLYFSFGKEKIGEEGLWQAAHIGGVFEVAAVASSKQQQQAAAAAAPPELAAAAALHVNPLVEGISVCNKNIY